MKAFLEEYGITLFVIVCIGILVAMAEPVGTVLQTALVAAINSFTTGTLNG